MPVRGSITLIALTAIASSVAAEPVDRCENEPRISVHGNTHIPSMIIGLVANYASFDEAIQSCAPELAGNVERFRQALASEKLEGMLSLEPRPSTNDTKVFISRTNGNFCAPEFRSAVISHYSELRRTESVVFQSIKPECRLTQ